MAGSRQTYIPKDYQDLYETYLDPAKHHFVQGLIERWAPHAEAEDLLHEIWIKFSRLDLLNKFDPARGCFGLFLQQVARSVVLTHLKVVKRNEPVNVDWGLAEGTRKVASDRVFEPTQENRVEGVEVYRRIDAYVKKMRRGTLRPNDTSLRKQLAFIIDSLSKGNTILETAAHLGVASSTIINWRERVKEEAA